MPKCRYWFLVLGMATLVSACTVGVFSGRVTVDQRPMIWKNRDVTDPDQAVRYFTDGRYPYLALIYAGQTDCAWAGINQTGFAIMNSNSFNIGDGIETGIGDGQTMKLALQTCVTIADFRALLDSLNLVGRTTPCNLGVMDASGATAVFEAGAFTYFPWYTDSLADGYIVRANFSMCADTAGQKSNNRYLRASQLVANAVARSELTGSWLLENVAKDLGQTDFDPYPLPFSGRVESLPAGMLPATGTISRTSTRSVVVITGPAPGEPVDLSTMWTMLGEPSISLALPLWVGAQSVPDGLADRLTADLCDEAKRMKTYAYSDANHPSAINSYRVAEVDQFMNSTANEIYRETGDHLRDWARQAPGQTDFANVQQDLADIALTEYSRFWQAHPAEEPQESTVSEFRVVTRPGEHILEAVFPGNTVSPRLLVYDATGRQVSSFDLSGYPVSGTRYFQWGSDEMASGLYFAALVSGDKRQTASFVYLR